MGTANEHWTATLTREVTMRFSAADRALSALRPEESALVLALLASEHAEIAEKAAEAARVFLDDVDCLDVAEQVEAVVRGVDQDVLYRGSGRTAWGYVDPAEVRWGNLDEQIGPFLDDLRRRGAAGLRDAARHLRKEDRMPRRKGGRTSPAGAAHSGRPRLSKTELEALVEQAIVDAYGESEQATGLYTLLDEHLVLPFSTVVLGEEVVVEKVDLAADDDIVAVCRKGRSRQSMRLLDLPLPDPPPEGWEWIEAYRYWARGWR